MRFTQASWRDYPHLFTNGNFKIKYGDNICEFMGVDRNGLNYRLWYPGLGVFSGEDGVFKSKTVCTLIARRIEDMTDEEYVWCERNSESPALEPEEGYDIKQIKALRKEHEMWNDLGISATNMLNYLELGVYPFSNKHFDEGIVLDINDI